VPRKPRHLRGKEISGEMEKDGRGKADRVQTVQYASVSMNQAPPILHAAVAFNGRHDKAAHKAHRRNQQRHCRCLPEVERCDPPQARAQRCRACNAADDPSIVFDGDMAGAMR